MSEDRKAARRAWIATHHPDRGGDPASFAAGLARFDSQLGADGGIGQISGYRQRGPVRLLSRWLRQRRHGSSRRRLR